MRIKSALVAGALGLASLAANAADISLAGIPTSQFAIDGNAQTFNYTSSVADSAATFSFVLQGYKSVDGYNNGYDDLFRVSVNGEEVAFGFFNLGGGGTNLAFAGRSAPVVDANARTVTFSNLAINLKKGTNTFSFNYLPIGSSNAGGQGIADEAWGIKSATITAAVPEPETYAMLLAGLTIVGGMARRRKAA